MVYWHTAAANLAVAPMWLAVVERVLWVVVALWIVGALLTLIALARQRLVAPSADDTLKSSDAPLVSIIVAARNEERRVLRDSLRSMLAQDYGRFEVIAVDDRSTDATGLILRALAHEDSRLSVISGEPTREGWLGKPYAMQQALARARGQWVLATDADMLLDGAALRTAVSDAGARGSDALTFIPHFEAGSFWERAFIPTWYWSLLVLYPLDIINHPRTPLALGIGGFFLLKREALARVGGYEAVRDEVLEDVRLAETLKRAGFRARAEYAPRLARTRMYTNLSELWESTTKNLFAGFKFSLTLALVAVVWTLTLAVLPPLATIISALALALRASGAEALLPLLVPAALAWLLQVVLMAAVNRRCGIRAVYALAAPAAFALGCAIILDSAFGVATGRGVRWKGRRIYERTGVRPPRARWK